MGNAELENTNTPRPVAMPKAEKLEIKLDTLGENKLTIYITPATVEALETEHSISQQTSYRTQTVGNVTTSTPVTHVQSSNSYNAYFQLENGEKVHRQFSANPNFIQGYRAVLVDGESKIGKGRYPISVLNVESKRPFFWPSYELEDLGIYKKQFWAIRSYIIMGLMTFIIVPVYKASGVLWFGCLIWAAINYLRGRQNNKIYEKLCSEVKQALEKYH